MLENKCPNCGRNLDTGLKCPVCSLRTKEIKTPSEMGAELGEKIADKLCDLIFENKKGVSMPKKIIFIGEFQRQKIRSGKVMPLQEAINVGAKALCSWDFDNGSCKTCKYENSAENCNTCLENEGYKDSVEFIINALLGAGK